MRYTISYERRGPGVAVAAPAAFRLADVEAQANRLRAWALIRGARSCGQPFMVRESPLSGSVLLPIEPGVVPHPETGLVLEPIRAGTVMMVGPVPFVEMRAVDREICYGLEEVCAPTGPAEFHPGEDGFTSGILVRLVRAMPAKCPADIAMLGIGAIASEGEHTLVASSAAARP